ncbi:MAG: PVC-type heme-binding CxxCH protein [Gemmataceae bacterium]
MPRAFALVLLLPSVCLAQGFSPTEAVRRMTLPPGFHATCIAHEPMIRQPLSISYDERGRLWVLQYLQYPNPAGLKAVKQDQYLRTVWDRVPEPPPKGPKGLDRITILSDPDQNGVYRKSKDFLTGLNLASGFCVGHGGVYVVQPPYLLFYADRNGDDIPDSETPEVLLTGFGMEDTHSLANSLQWGPDGWLYGAHGSTVSAKIKNPAYPNEAPVEFQQGVWRFHPRTKRFELFAEGGGNTYGLDFDREGQCIAGTNYGGFAMLHHRQGGYYVKGFSKHGPLHNAHTYGYFDHVPYTGFKGGHVTCGGILYLGDTFPTEYRDHYLAGNLLSNDVYWHRLTAKGSSFTAKHGGELLTSNDTWCRPVDLILGPDGSVSIADWYDKRAAHLDPIDNWDKTNGRVYKIQFDGAKPLAAFDMRDKSTVQLCELLGHANAWWRRESRRLLAERNDQNAVPILKAAIQSGEGIVPLESLWALAGMSALNGDDLVSLFTHREAIVREWAVRLLADDPKKYETKWTNALVGLAQRETNPSVRAQLACTAKRLPVNDNVGVVRAVLMRDAEADAQLPLLLWWAIEAAMSKSPESSVDLAVEVMDRMALPAPLLVENVTRRLLAGGFKNDVFLLSKLLDRGMALQKPEAMIRGFHAAQAGGSVKLDPELMARLNRIRSDRPNDEQLLTILIRANDEAAVREARRRVEDGKQPAAERARKLELLTQIRDAEANRLATAAIADPSEAVQFAALATLSANETAVNLNTIRDRYAKSSPAMKKRIVQTMAGRKSWALALLDAVESKTMAATDVSEESLRGIVEWGDEPLTAKVTKLFGKIGPATPGEKLARISWLQIQVGRLKGDVTSGKELFTKTCANCHQLFGEGNKVGPDLTAADRTNLGYMLAQIVDPSAAIRPEYIQHRLTTTDGRVLNGLVVESTDRSVTLVDAQNVKTVVPRSSVEELKPLPVSLMPEKLLDTLTDQQVADLFAYLRRQPSSPAEKRP